MDPATVAQLFGVVVHKPIKIKNLENKSLDDKTENEQMNALYEDINNIKYISKPTDAMCKYVVYRNPSLFKYCKNLKSSLCNMAVSADPNNLEFAINTSSEVIMNALCKDGLLLKHVRIYWKNNMREIAVKQNGLALQYVEISNRTFNLCKLAVLQTEDAIRYVPSEICKNTKFKLAMLEKYLYYWTQIIPNIHNCISAVIINPAVVLMFGKINPEMMCLIIRANYKVAKYVNLSDDARKEVLDQNADAITYLIDPTWDDFKYAVTQYPSAIQHFVFDYELSLLAVTQDGMVLEFIHKENQSPPLVAAAIQQNAEAIRYVSATFIDESMLMRVAPRYPKVVKILEILNYETNNLFSIDKINKLVLSADGMMLEFIKDPSEELQRLAITNNPYAIQFIEEPSLELQLLAVDKDPLVLAQIHCQSIEACKRAVALDQNCLPFISRDVWNDMIYLAKYDKL